MLYKQLIAFTLTTYLYTTKHNQMYLELLLGYMRDIVMEREIAGYVR